MLYQNGKSRSDEIRCNIVSMNVSGEEKISVEQR